MAHYLASLTGMHGVWPNDRVLREHLATRPLAGTIRRRRMVLEAIEEHMRGEKTERLVRTDNLTLEHVMPKNWQRHWPLPEGSLQEDE